MTIKLSICIPTYNRAAYIEKTINSILMQATNEVEIVISDNASTDNTEEIVKNLQKNYTQIVYYRSPVNLGADCNYLKVVELAHGKYCWLLGSDDALIEGALRSIWPFLDKSEILLTDRINMSSTMEHELSHEKMLNAQPGKTYDCSDDNQLIAYFKDANSIGSLFSYLSSILINRESWMNQPDNQDLIGSAWIHVSKIFLMMRSGAKITYVGQALVRNRCGNDSFHAALGYTRRRLVDLNYPNIGRSVFGDNANVMAELITVVARQYFNWRVLLSDKRSAIEADGPLVAQQLVEKYKVEFKFESNYMLKMTLIRCAKVDPMGKTIFQRI